jgi:hypothetical protein
MMGIIPKQPKPASNLSEEAEGECEGEESVHPDCLNTQMLEVVLDIIEVQAVQPCSFDGWWAGLDSFASFNNHFTEGPTNGCLVDLVHWLEMVFLLGFQQTLFSCSSFGFRVCIAKVSASQGVVTTSIDQSRDTDTLVKYIWDPSAFEALHLESRQLDLNVSLISHGECLTHLGA